MIRTHTLTDLDAQQSLYGLCNECQRTHKLNLIKIINTIGDFSFDELRERLRCDACGSKDTDFLCVWEGNAREMTMPRM